MLQDPLDWFFIAVAFLFAAGYGLGVLVAHLRRPRI